MLAGIQCTYEEIASVCKISKRQFIEHVQRDAELRGIIEDGWASGRMSVRRQQFKLLAEGNVTMAIWLGKQYLGQRDRVDNRVTGAEGGPLQTHNVTDLELLETRIARIVERRGTT